MLKKILLGFGGLIVLIIIVSALGGDSNQPASPQENSSGSSSQPSEPSATETWQPVKSWTGTGIKQTEPFTITGKQWRINWSNTDKSGITGGSVLQVMVYKVGGQLPVTIAANAQGTASDTSYVYEKGEFYLSMNSANGDWSVSVEELK